MQKFFSRKASLASVMKGLEGRAMHDKRQEKRFPFVLRFALLDIRLGLKARTPFENCALPDIKATDAQEAAVAKPVRNMARVKKAGDCAPLKMVRVKERGREKPQQRQTV